MRVQWDALDCRQSGITGELISLSKIKTEYQMLVWLSRVESLNSVELVHIVMNGSQVRILSQAPVKTAKDRHS